MLHLLFFLVAVGALFALSPTTQSIETSTSLRVTTFNIRYANPADGENAWSKRAGFAIETIRNHRADILGLQEVLDSQRAELVAALPEYTFIGVGRDDGKTKGEFSPLMIRTTRFDIIDSGTIWLSETPDVIGSKGWDAVLPRIATFAILRDKQDQDREIAVFNAHFDHVGVKAREASAALLRSRVEATTLPAIVMGDFNCHETDAPCVTLAGSLTDAYRQVHPAVKDDEATWHSFNGKTAGKRIDYIYTRGYRAIDAEIDHSSKENRFPSDHFPIRATLVHEPS